MMARSQFGEPHGQKRHAEDEVEAGTGISNHFKKLRISTTTTLTIFRMLAKALMSLQIMLRSAHAFIHRDLTMPLHRSGSSWQ